VGFEKHVFHWPNILPDTRHQYQITVCDHFPRISGKKVKASHTHYRAKRDPGVQAVSPQVTISHPPGSRLPLLSARPAVAFPAAEHHHPLAGTKLYCLVTKAHRCEQLAQGCYVLLP